MWVTSLPLRQHVAAQASTSTFAVRDRPGFAKVVLLVEGATSEAAGLFNFA